MKPLDPYDQRYRLIPDMIPSTAWFANIREQFPRDWDALRRGQYRRAGGKCEICGARGSRFRRDHPLHCHEVWTYNESVGSVGVQRLERLIALCPDCHHVKHAGFWGIVQGHMDEVLGQLAYVNRIHKDEANDLLNAHFDSFERRSERPWVTDMSFLTTLGVEGCFTKFVFAPSVTG